MTKSQKSGPPEIATSADQPYLQLALARKQVAEVERLHPKEGLRARLQARPWVGLRGDQRKRRCVILTEYDLHMQVSAA